MTEAAQKFFELCQTVTEDTKEEAIKQLPNFNFLQFTLSEIDKLESVDWIPLPELASIYRSWIDQHDRVLNSIVSYLLFNTETTRDLSVNFAESIMDPSKIVLHPVENIIYKIATANGKREYLNLLEAGIFTASSSEALNQKGVDALFKNIKDAFFNSKPLDNSYVQISFPPFMQVQVLEYTIGTGRNMFPQTWILEGSNDKISWEPIDNKLHEKSVSHEFTKYTFQATAGNTKFYSHFKFTLKEDNSNNNKQLVLSALDFTGYVNLVKK